ncbi:MAG: zf-HC2 domain-containing protein [Ignavibacteria bacterium]|nr:zf-HC2 domain-containing protein [Ignavibacteria bacterium]
MSCEKIKPLLFDYFEKNISEGRVRNLKSHLETCRFCAEELTEFENLSQLLKKETSELINKHFFYFENLRLNNSNKLFEVRKQMAPIFRFAAGLALVFYLAALFLFTNFTGWNIPSNEFQTSQLIYPNSGSELINDNSYENIGKLYDQISDETIMQSDYLNGEYEMLMQMNSKLIPSVENYLGRDYNLIGLSESDFDQILKSLNYKEII